MNGSQPTKAIGAKTAATSRPERAYMLLEVRDGRTSEAQRIIRQQPGVVSADIVAGPPDLLVITEADEFDDLVRQSVSALVSVEELTVSIRCLPVKPAATGSPVAPSANGAQHDS